MVTTPTAIIHSREKRLERALVGGSITAAAGGVATIILSILGLVHIEPLLMAPIAAIVMGTGLLSESGALAAEYSEILSKTRQNRWRKVEFGSGFSAEMLAGIAVITLGILSLLNLEPLVLLPVSVIALGVCLLLSTGTKALLNSMRLEIPENHRKAEMVAHTTLRGAIWVQLVVGLVAIVLGILALAGWVPPILTLVAMLAIGTSILLSGAAVSARMLSAYSAHTPPEEISNRSI
ncbi:hypothetical protein [Nitrosococcus watsonii]|uniref:Transmembrane protein n=1 Tax=Nitrosococcus watsoni (strain C-113) TaxID=105559 RepID=D8K9P7_NITWC|nr:hypothetical protein [Nitrosococcus watsonii]ADJ27336.1 conserved hypothetical protein [Nitrosococcus watsonii C-113]